MDSDVKPGVKSTEFWIQMVAHFAPVVAAYVMNAVAPSAPWAAAVLGVVTAIAGHYSASQYSDDRAGLKQAAADAFGQVAAAQAAVATQLAPQVAPAPAAK